MEILQSPQIAQTNKLFELNSQYVQSHKSNNKFQPQEDKMLNSHHPK